jgi:hypothetical protein
MTPAADNVPHTSLSAKLKAVNQFLMDPYTVEAKRALFSFCNFLYGLKMGLESVRSD